MPPLNLRSYLYLHLPPCLSLIASLSNYHSIAHTHTHTHTHSLSHQHLPPTILHSLLSLLLVLSPSTTSPFTAQTPARAAAAIKTRRKPNLNARSGVRTHAEIPPVDLKSTALTTRPSWHPNPPSSSHTPQLHSLHYSTHASTSPLASHCIASLQSQQPNATPCYTCTPHTPTASLQHHADTGLR